MAADTPVILIAEDEEALRETIVEIVSSVCPHVIAASDGQQALDLFNKNRVALVVSDINMPNMSGLDLLRSIRKTGRDVPLIFVTAHSLKNYIVEAFRLGATDYIEKPFDVDELMKKVEQAYSLGLAVLDVEADLEKVSHVDNLPAEHIKRLKECQKAVRLMEIENQQNERNKKDP